MKGEGRRGNTKHSMVEQDVEEFRLLSQ
uniref:Uncharacterized protein n=1 Tax=Arundo donax TaxID=35708 RepID=A0A0A8YQL6_ARUDO